MVLFLFNCGQAAVTAFRVAEKGVPIPVKKSPVKLRHGPRLNHAAVFVRVLERIHQSEEVGGIVRELPPLDTVIRII